MSVVVVSYNARSALSECLRSVPGGFRGEAFEIVVADNDSIDGSSDLVAKEFPEAHLIRTGGNLGFARAVNLAAEASSGNHLLMLNPDTVVHAGAISRLLAAAQRHPLHLLWGGRTVLPDGTPDIRSCWALPGVWSMVCFGLGLSTIFRGSRVFDPESLAWRGRETTYAVEGVSGSFLLVRREDWMRLGGFDVRFFMYSEDADLCVRVAQTGSCPLFVSDATVTHLGGASSEDHAAKTVLVMAGKATLIDKHWHPGLRWLGLALLRLGVVLRVGLAVLLGRRATARQRSWIGVWAARGRWRWGYQA